VSPFVSYLFIVFLPAAVLWVLVSAYDRLGRYNPAPKGPVVADRSIEQLAGDLRRLRLEETRLRQSDLPAKAARLRSLMLAYDDTLCASCRAVGLPAPGPPPLHHDVRRRIEAALGDQGLGW
jgi:hypothetical protein